MHRADENLSHVSHAASRELRKSFTGYSWARGLRGRVQFSQNFELNSRRPLDFLKGFEAFETSLSPFRPLDGIRGSQHDFRDLGVNKLSASEKHPSPETNLVEVQ